MTPRGVKKAFFFPVAKGNKGFAFTLPRPPPATGKSTVIARLHFNVLGTRPKMYLKDSYYAARYSLMDNLSTFTIFNIFESFEIILFPPKISPYHLKRVKPLKLKRENLKKIKVIPISLLKRPFKTTEKLKIVSPRKMASSELPSSH